MDMESCSEHGVGSGIVGHGFRRRGHPLIADSIQEWACEGRAALKILGRHYEC